MSNRYSPPQIEKRNNAVEEQVAAEENMDKSTGVPTEKVPTDAVGIYKQGIDKFKEFLGGNFEGNLDDRKKFQRDFIRNCWSMLELSDAQVKEIMDHFIVTIAENRDLFDYNKLIAPLFSLESELPSTETERYKRFMLFVTMLSENAGDRNLFLQRYDMVRFENMFSPTAKLRLHNYVYR